MSTEERVVLTVEEAEAMLLVHDGAVHTILQSGNVLIGGDWSREAVLDCFRRTKVELSGEQATKMGHGLVTWLEDGTPLFVETRREDAS